MNKELTEISQNMAEEKYDGSVPNRRSLIRAYLAGFEARDGMLNEEHAEMLEVLKGVIPHIEWMGRKKLTPANFNVVQHIKKVITKIESKNTNSI